MEKGTFAEYIYIYIYIYNIYIYMETNFISCEKYTANEN